MARSLSVAKASRAETMTQPAWRVRVRRVDRGGASVDLSTLQGRGTAVQGAPRFWNEAWNRRDATDINVELEERPAGSSRFRPIVQAIGVRVLWWVSQTDAPDYGVPLYSRGEPAAWNHDFSGRA